jgi:lipid II:glycine glycyltransferase (peptidoglycan interpeptide bridge formation enzyme)
MMEFQSGVNRKYRDKQGSTALHWHCIRLAQKEGYKLYDFGGCTPGLDRSDDRYNVYSYKKNFSGELVKFYTAEIILNEKIKEWQDKYLSKAWDTIHPYYYKIARLFK